MKNKILSMKKAAIFVGVLMLLSIPPTFVRAETVPVTIEGVAVSPSVERLISKKISADIGGTIFITENLSEELAGLELHIPPGALAENTVITIGEVTGCETAHLEGCSCNRLNISVSLEPSGLTFKKPAIIQIPLPAELHHEGDITPERITLKKYNKDSNTWTNIPVKYIENNKIVADIKSFCFLGIVGLFCPNPACEHRIFEQARDWKFWLSDKELEKILKDANMFVDSDATFADMIGHLLLAEAWWNIIKDGKFHGGVNLMRLAAKEIAKGAAIGKALELAKLGALKVSAKAVTPISLTLAYLIEKLPGIAINQQLLAYLSWRGWFFEGDKWHYIEARGRTHELVMNSPLEIPRGIGGWLLRGQLSSGQLFGGGYLWRMPPPDISSELFFQEFGNFLYELLHEVHCTPRSRGNQLVEDRNRLENLFGNLRLHRPVAKVTAPVGVYVGYAATIDGSASEDPLGPWGRQPLEFEWFEGDHHWRWETGQQFTFTPNRAGVRTFSLVVSDGLLNSIPATVTINVWGKRAVPPGDVTPPTINSFTVEPASITAGAPVTVSFTARDNTGGSGLSRIVLNRASGEPTYWEAIAYYCFERHYFSSLKGNNKILAPWPWDGPIVSGAFQDTPPSAGTFWYGVTVFDKAANRNCEQNSQTNNQPGDFGPDKVEVTVDQAALPELTPTAVALSRASARVGDTVAVTFTVANKGGPFANRFRNVVFLSTRQFGGPGAQNVFMGSITMTLDGTTSKTETVEVTIPDVAAGNWYIAVFTDGGMVIDERNEMNNIDSRAISITDQPADDPEPELTGITITPETATVTVGRTRQFTASPIPADAVLGEVTWSVDNKAIGTIDTTGLFTALAPGTVKVTATSVVNATIYGTAIVIVAEQIPVIPRTFAGGSGTKDDPYQIANIYQLQLMDERIYLTKHFVLVNDIDASATRYWPGGFNPIGAFSSVRFTGTLVGLGYTVNNLYMSSLLKVELVDFINFV